MEIESSRGQRGRFRREGGSILENTREREGKGRERGRMGVHSENRRQRGRQGSGTM